MSGLAAKGRGLKVEANECPTPNDALLSAGQVSGNTSWALDSSLEAARPLLLSRWLLLHQQYSFVCVNKKLKQSTTLGFAPQGEL